MNALNGNMPPNNLASDRANDSTSGQFPLPVTQIGSVIKATRKEYGLTQQQLADLAGVSDRTVRTLEQGGLGPTLRSLLAVTGTLGLKVEVSNR